MTAPGSRLRVTMRVAVVAATLVAGLTFSGCTHESAPAIPTDVPHRESPQPNVPRPEGHGELRWASDIDLEDRPSAGLASRGYVLFIPMDAHDQWWSALGWGVQPMVEVEYLDGRVVSPYGMYQGANARVGRDLLDEVAKFGTVSVVSQHGYFLEPTEPGLYWACVADDYSGGLWVSGCDIVLLGEHHVVLNEHMGDVTATSEYKDYSMDYPEGWTNIPGFNSSAAPEV